MQINNNSSVFKRPKSLMCYICGREFGTKSLSIHIKTCEKMFIVEEEKKPKKDRRALPQPPQGLIELLAKDEITFDDIEKYNNRAFKKYEEEVLIKCQFCNRTFNENSYKNHHKYCSADRPFKPLTKQEEASQEQPIISNKTQQKPSANTLEDVQINKSKNNFNEQIEEHKNVDLIQCQICERSFASDRIEKHQKICIKQSQKSKIAKDDSNFDNTPQKTLKTQKQDMNQLVKSAVNLKSQNEKEEKLPKWKKQHEDLVNNIKYNKKLKEVEEAGGDINSIEKPQSLMQDDRVQCPYCFRKFNQLAADRHIPVCQNTIHKPKPPPNQQQNQNQQKNQSNNTIKKQNQQLSSQQQQQFFGGATNVSKSVVVPSSNKTQTQSAQKQNQQQQQNVSGENSKQYNLYQPVKSYKFNY